VAGHDAVDPGRLQYQVSKHAVERLAGHALGNQRERLVVGVAVGPARAGRKAARRGCGEGDISVDRRRGVVGERSVAVQPEEVGEPGRLCEQVRDAQAGLVGEPLGQVLADARVEPQLAGIGERQDRRRGELLRDRAQGKHRRGIGRRPARADRAIAPLQQDLVAAQDRQVRGRDAFPREERARRGVCVVDIRPGRRGRGGAGSGQEAQGNRSLQAGHPIGCANECAA
jgi:hypothetical protein